ncbi:MAG: ATP-dependent RecD-like DNA helicase [Acholeplasmataceae bacterium]|nr:ATP-dependent RecD-like DNA helicase [Acholeplasmataceae bacterium]
MDTLTGRFKNTVYRNPDNGYQIARIITETGDTETIVGYFPLFAEDSDYEFVGNWTTHPTYGSQFKVETFKKMKTQSEHGLVSYLSSSFFTGIGPKTAQKIVDGLGLDAIDQILEDMSVLKKVGFSPVKIKRFHQELLDHQANEHILVSLYGYDISGKLAMKLIERYGMSTLETIEENPYRLIEDIEGIGFLKADQIALKLGFSETDPRRIKAAILFVVEGMVYQNGDTSFSREGIITSVQDQTRISEDVEPMIDVLVEEGKLIVEGDLYTLFISHQAETMLSKSIQRISGKDIDPVDDEYVKTLIDAVEIQRNINYTTIQKEAIITVMRHPLTVITGGPGTGKTTIIEGLIDVYRMVNKLSARQIKETVGLMAPTGRAAKRMKELLGMEAKTIHRHLGFTFEGHFAFDASNPLPYQLIVIDEASMIDLFLARRLFDAILTETKVVIVGDVDQLPSVGPGMVLADLIDSNILPVVRLSEIHRQAQNSHIVRLARAVNQQMVTDDNLQTSNDVYLYRCSPERLKHVLASQIKGAMNLGHQIIEDIQVLAPMYKGDLGIDALNAFLKETFNPGSGREMRYGDRVYHVGDKVIQLANDLERNIMNGDIGVIKTIGEDGEGTAYMTVDYDDNSVLYRKVDLENISLAYCVSIHKAQGSEYKIVMMPMVRAYAHMLRKELIYTAITRAKEMLIVFGDIGLLSFAANRLMDQRMTTLDKRLRNEIDDAEDLTEDLSPYDFM